MKRVVLLALGMLLLGSSSVGESCQEGMVPTGIGTCIDEFEWPNVRGERPVVGLSGMPEEADEQAGIMMSVEELCASVGKRACTLDEWIEACRGPGRSRFPFGEKLPKYSPDDGDGLCNYDKWYRSPDERKVMLREPEEMSRLDQTDPSGERESCRSASGAYDMMGNTEEWVRCPGVGTYGWCLMGRYWAQPEPCSFTVVKHSPKWHYYQSGGRCCSGGSR